MSFLNRNICLVSIILVFSYVDLTQEGNVPIEYTQDLFDEQDGSQERLQMVETKIQKGGDPFGNITCTESDCSRVNGSICLDGLCACPQNEPIFVNVTEGAYEGVCLESFNRTKENCTYTQQCDYDHGFCSNQVCTCAKGYTSREDGTCNEIKKSAIIPIVVGTVIGAAIICTLGAYCWMTRKDQKNM